MSEAKFILNKNIALNQIKILENIGLKISYSYKTNHEIGNILQKESNVMFSIHSKYEIDMIKDKRKIIFFLQAENEAEIVDLIKIVIKNFVIDNEIDIGNLLNAIKK